MITNLLKLLSPSSADSEYTNQLDTVIREIDSSIQTIKTQRTKITEQEEEILKKTQHYHAQYNQKITRTKEAFRSQNEWEAESIYQEAQIIQRQTDQYSKIVKEIQDTKRRLLAQENHFLLTRDELSAKKTLGEANVDASQLKAEISEQLMFLNESDELSKFDELINEASYKSQAIDEIQEAESELDHYLKGPDQTSEGLQKMIQEEKAQKVQAAQRNQQILIERTFGKMTPVSDQEQKENQKALLDRLRQSPDVEDENKNRIDKFFESSEEPTEPKSSANTQDKDDRIKNFFR